MSTNIAFFDEKMDVFKEIFASYRSGRGVKVPKYYLGCFSEFKSGIGLEFGGKMRILRLKYVLTFGFEPSSKKKKETIKLNDVSTQNLICVSKAHLKI